MNRLRVLNLPAGYARQDLWSDVVAGAITATLLIPQAMAYSQLAGLPPEIGLYASMLPPVLYALAGSSRTLAVGPVAVASLMLAGSLGAIWPAGSAEYLTGAFMVAAMTGVILTVLGIARLGVVANFLSHPVLSGFTNAAALVIVISQIKPLLGLHLPQGSVYQTLGGAIQALPASNIATAVIGTCAVAFLLAVKRYGDRALAALHIKEQRRAIFTRLAPLMLVIGGTLIAAYYNLADAAGVAVTGAIPQGLPNLTVPSVASEHWGQLFIAALAIALVSFVESLSIAKVLAARRRERIDPDRELIGLGVANFGAAFTGASPVCGGFSRSVVNFEAGARSQVAAIVCSLLIAVTALFFTPLLFHLPTAVLAAIVVVSVASLFDLHTLKLCLRYNRADAFALISTFAVVLSAGMEAGIAVGIGVSLALFLWRSSRPHIAVVGRLGNTEHFRNVERHSVTTYPSVLAMRIDESLYFANAQTLEARLLNAIAEQPEVQHLVLICSAVNSIDTSALETLENLVAEMRVAGVTLHLAEVKGPVMDRLEHIEFAKQLAPGRIYLSTHEAINQLTSNGELPWSLNK
jgi:SulP family sulfate permease